MAGIGLVVTLVTDWFIRAVVVISLIAHVFLAIFAGIRRRQAYGAWTSFLWMAYQVAGWATPYLLGNVTLGSTSLEQQLVELWLPFLVTQLGGPDNITAYSLEDNKLSFRLYASVPVKMFSIGLLMYKQFQIATSKGVLFWASLVMVVVAAYKYLERVVAFWKADFGNLISKSSKKKQRTLRIQPCRSGKELGNDKALLLAHELLDITKQAFADDYLGKEAEKQLQEDSNLKKIFSVQRGDTGWKNMCRVVEMELSLMYDILYTKATVAHDWYGYAIRIVSPAVTATVMLLFWLDNKQGQRTADVIISYSLMLVTLLLDVRWLVGAAASTWTYAFFNSSPRRWLHHEVCCTRWWRQLRHFVVSLDPWQWPLREHGGCYRRWSGIIGQYNLFDEVTNGHGTTSGWLASLAKKLSLEDAWMDYKYSKRLNLDSTADKDVRELLFTQIQRLLKMAPPPLKVHHFLGDDLDFLPPAAAGALGRHRDLDEDLDFLPEFQELILIWHVTTEVFLLDRQERHIPEEEREYFSTTKEEEEKYVKAIKAVSNYMAFLAAVRFEMLPGLKLRSQHQATHEALNNFWRPETGRRSTYTSLSSTTEDKKKGLVDILRKEEKEKGPGEIRSVLYRSSVVLSDGIQFANLLRDLVEESQENLSHDEYWNKKLLKKNKILPEYLGGEGSIIRKRFMALIPYLEELISCWTMLGMLNLLFKSWVRMLIYVSIRCSRDSHAKQLGRGCELTTVVWILSEHATMFAQPDVDDIFDSGMLQRESHAMQSSPSL